MLPGLQACAGEAGGVRERSFPEHPVRDLHLILIFVKENRAADPAGVSTWYSSASISVCAWSGFRTPSDCARLATLRSAACGAWPCAASRKRKQIARRLARCERLLGQAGAELALQAQHQLDARQAVEAELALERAVERDVRVDVRARFLGDRGDHAEHAIGVDFLGVGGHSG